MDYSGKFSLGQFSKLQFGMDTVGPPPKPFPLGFMVQGRLGYPTDPDPLNVRGIYQARMTKRGKVPIKMKFYAPYNPNSPAQQVQRNKFKSAMLEWNNLTSEQKWEYHRRARKVGLPGMNLFVKEYYQSNS